MVLIFVKSTGGMTFYLLKNEGIQLRRNEKKFLNDINMDKDGQLRFHILGDKGKRKRRIQTREEKIFVLANDCLTGNPSVHDLSLTQVSTSQYIVYYSNVPNKAYEILSFWMCYRMQMLYAQMGVELLSA